MGNSIQNLSQTSAARLLKRYGLAGCILLIAAAAVQVRFQAHEAALVAKPERARSGGMPIPVRTTRVSHSDVVEVLGATGVTAPSLTVKVQSGRTSDPGPKDYIVRSVPAVSGSYVPKGTVLFEFDDTVYHQVLKHRQAELAAAAEIHRAPGKLDSRLDVLTAEADYERARLALELAHLDLESCRVKSTINGYVGDANLAPGDRVEFGRVLTELTQLDPIHVVMDLPQERLLDVQVGHPAEVSLDPFPNETFIGQVIRVPSSGEIKTRTMPVVVEISNPDHRIRAGVSGFVRVQIRRNAITVPSVAAIRHGEKAMVFRVEENRARIREVEVGKVLEPGCVEIRAGLSSGDEVVIFNTQYLQDNDPVNTDWKSWSRRAE